MTYDYEQSDIIYIYNDKLMWYVEKLMDKSMLGRVWFMAFNLIKLVFWHFMLAFNFFCFVLYSRKEWNLGVLKFFFFFSSFFQVLSSCMNFSNPIVCFGMSFTVWPKCMPAFFIRIIGPIQQNDWVWYMILSIFILVFLNYYIRI